MDIAAMKYIFILVAQEYTENGLEVAVD